MAKSRDMKVTVVVRDPRGFVYERDVKNMDDVEEFCGLAFTKHVLKLPEGNGTLTMRPRTALKCTANRVYQVLKDLKG